MITLITSLNSIKKVIDTMKDESSKKIMSDFVCLRSKVCTYLNEREDETTAKK